MQCMRCGCENDSQNVKCDVCGAPLINENIEEVSAQRFNKKKSKSKRKRGVALFCAWIGFGLYEWYLGDVGAAWIRFKNGMKAFLLCFVLIGFILVFFEWLHNMKDMLTVLFSSEIYDVDGNVIKW